MAAIRRSWGPGLGTVCLLLAAVGLAACSTGSGASRSEQTPRPMPAFDLETLDGGRLSSAELAGRVVLVDLWATWCGPCLVEIPHWNELQERYAQQGFTVLGITIQSGWASDIRGDIEGFDFEIKYPVVVGTDEVERAFGGILGFPTAFLVARDGKIYRKFTGTYPAKREEIEAAIKRLLSETPEEEI